MSVSLTAFAADLPKLLENIGNGSQELVLRIQSTNAARLDELDEFESNEDDGFPESFKGKPEAALSALQDDLAKLQSGATADSDSLLGWFLEEKEPPESTPPAPTAREWLSRWILEPSIDLPGHLEQPLFHMLVAQVGQELPSDCWKELRAGAKRVLEQQLAAVGFADGLGPEVLFERPLPTTPSRSIPGVGCIAPAEMGPCIQALRGDARAGTTPEVRQCLSQLLHWLELCRDRNLSLVCLTS